MICKQYRNNMSSYFQEIKQGLKGRAVEKPRFVFMFKKMFLHFRRDIILCLKNEDIDKTFKVFKEICYTNSPPSSGIFNSFFAPGLGPRTADKALCRVSLMGFPLATCPNIDTINRNFTTLALTGPTLRQLESCFPISLTSVYPIIRPQMVYTNFATFFVTSERKEKVWLQIFIS